MNQQIFTLFMCFVGTIMASAQSGSLPPVTFSSPTNICDATPYKLVFYDEFDGNSLKSPWLNLLSTFAKQ